MQRLRAATRDAPKTKCHCGLRAARTAAARCKESGDTLPGPLEPRVGVWLRVLALWLAVCGPWAPQAARRRLDEVRPGSRRRRIIGLQNDRHGGLNLLDCAARLALTLRVPGARPGPRGDENWPFLGVCVSTSRTTGLDDAPAPRARRISLGDTHGPALRLLGRPPGPLGRPVVHVVRRLRGALRARPERTASQRARTRSHAPTRGSSGPGRVLPDSLQRAAAVLAALRPLVALALRGVSGGGSEARHETTLLQLKFRTLVPQRPVSADQHHTRVEQRPAPPPFLPDSTGKSARTARFSTARFWPRRVRRRATCDEVVRAREAPRRRHTPCGRVGAPRRHLPVPACPLYPGRARLR